jgi:hypothetical protein
MHQQNAEFKHQESFFIYSKKERISLITKNPLVQRNFVLAPGGPRSIFTSVLGNR